MRVPVRKSLSSARPTRGALLATLFGIVTIALVVAFGAGEEVDPLIEAGADSSSDQANGPASYADSGDLGAVDPASARAVSSPSIEADSDDSTDEFEANYQDPTSAFGDDELVLSAPSEPSTTTTIEPTTTAAPTTAAPEPTDPSTTETPDTTDTTVADDSSSSSEPDGSTSSTEDPTTSVADNGWVDTGNGVMVPPVLLSIRYCESRDNYQAANPSSSARGAYQFLTGSWASYGHAERYGVSQAHLATPAQQDEAALITWQADGTRPWNASKSCWG